MLKATSEFLNVCPRCLTLRQYRQQNKFFLSLKVARFLSSPSHYDVLNVPKDASQDEIKKAFFEKSKKFHPDVSPSNPHHHKFFLKLNNAYSVIGDKTKRKVYDASLKPQWKPYSRVVDLNKQRAHFYYDTYTDHDSQNDAKQSVFYRRNNNEVALVIIAMMLTGVGLRLLWLGYRHKQYKKQLDINSMKASKLYQESRERSSKYTVKEQLEMLAKKQGKIEKERNEYL
ncbi:dnaJ homolog subfamily C member 4-like isoform X1 [Xenia sp. Carnegie-2017]|uniref:dnaJ homolog subfamily C member 4-like isoform X1 n=1 Tax=Xenia sp. Carnegie-2017 TaxID=2897299 RepID=UPI001F0373F6|nr:dnaJ homolog subfamily C member 4-like isoform X1 [Xenia sp. Carnegie-2017]